MAKRETIGIEQSEEVNVAELLKDTRSSGEKFRQKLTKNTIALSPIILLLVSFIIPTYREYLLLIALIIFIKNKDKSGTVPLEKPQSSDSMDENNKHPGHGRAQKAEGISYYGQEKNTGREVWFSASKIKTHTLIMGTTGSGKTEYLLSICQNALTQASGFIYVDGKGDTLLYSKVFSLVRRMGREDDLLVVNFMNQGMDNRAPGLSRSNTLNPFSNGSSEELTELIVSLLPSDGDGMWKGRASIFMDGLMRVLVALRDANKLLLDVNTIRKYFNLDTIIKLIQRTDIKNKHLEGLKSYVENLPGYKGPTEKNQNPEQESEVYEQHGFITMQYTEVFGLLADQYSYIMKTQLGEIDFFDVVVRRRILVVLLPALSKSQQNLANLGKIIVTSVRSMMSHSLGGEIEGETEEVIDSKPTSADAPYLSIFDEYGYYAVQGAAVMPAQARSLNFSMVFAGQDYPAFKKSSPEDAASIVANCTIKIVMKLEEAEETAPIFLKAAGEAVVKEVGGLEKEEDGHFLTGNKRYKESKNIQFQKKERMTARDLRKQGAGEAHLLYGDTLVRIKGFFADPPISKKLAVNTFIKVKPPNNQIVEMLTNGLKKSKKKYNEILEDPAIYRTNIQEVFKEIGYSSELTTVLNAVKAKRDYNLDHVTFGVLPLAMLMEKVEWIDEKINEKVEKSYQEKTEEDIEKLKQEKEDIDDISEYQEKKYEEPEQSVDTILKKSKEDTADTIRKRIQSNISKKHNLLEKVDKEARATFEILKLNKEEVKNKVSKIEKEINSFIKESNIETEDNYEDLVGDYTVSEIGYQATPNKDKPPRRNNNDDFINSILNDISDDIED